MRVRLQHDDPVDYQVARHNSAWWDHVIRANVTAGAIASLGVESAFDPACGDGSILAAAHRLNPIARAKLTDISVPNIAGLSLPGDWTAEVLDIETSVLQPVESQWGVVVLTEILEHVENPADILRFAHRNARYLVASSPEMRHGQMDDNPEHLWQFDGEGYFQLLTEAGWTPFSRTHLAIPGSTYDFGIWLAQ